METVRALVLKARASNADAASRRAAFGELVRRYQDMAWGCAYAVLGDPVLAQDVAQEAFIAAYGSISRLRHPEAFAAWLRRIVYRQCSREFRANRLMTIPIEQAPDVPSPCPEPDAQFEASEIRSHVYDAVRALPEDQRVAITLFYLSGYAQKDIAAFLDVPASTVVNRLRAGRRQLRERLVDMVGDRLQGERPSRDTQFANAVQQAIAIRDRLISWFCGNETCKNQNQKNN